MNPQHYRSDPADFWIQIRINLEIRIRVPGSLLVDVNSQLSTQVYLKKNRNINKIEKQQVATEVWTYLCWPPMSVTKLEALTGGLRALSTV